MATKSIGITFNANARDDEKRKRAQYKLVSLCYNTFDQ